MTAKKIRVHERALAHLSRGLYRSPASALRELVSNAWDANATKVSIDTNHPQFFQLSVQDNGDGFTRKEFERLMGGGIGNSEKRVSERVLKFGRPLIGRLGIGMLGIAQICGSFTVASRTRSGEAFKARVTLYDLAKERMDREDSDLIHDASTRVGDEQVPSKIVDVGTYDFESFDAHHLRHGTIIVADEVTPTFTQAFQDSLRLPHYKAVPLEWKAAVTRTLSSAASLQLLGDYWRLLWELAATTPVEYLADDALPRAACREFNEKLSSYNFLLEVDGRQLFKPVFLKGNEGGYTAKSIPRQTIQVYGRPLTFSGYVVVQEGKQIKPDELRGVMVRIKNVGVGYFDPSMLDYRINEGPRSRWVTSEIYVEEGLEDALNIDRDSFNRFHPEFRALQEAVHGALQGEVFPAVYKNIEVRSKERREEVAKKREQATKAVVKAATDRPVRIVKRTETNEDGEIDIHSSATRHRDGVEIVVAKADDLPTSKTSRQLAQSVLTIFELALLEKDREQQRQKFADLLFDLLRHW